MVKFISLSALYHALKERRFWSFWMGTDEPLADGPNLRRLAC